MYGHFKFRLRRAAGLRRQRILTDGGPWTPQNPGQSGQTGAWGIEELPPKALGEPPKPHLYLPSEQPTHRLFLGQSVRTTFSWSLLSPEGPRSAGFGQRGGGHRRSPPRRSLPHWVPSCAHMRAQSCPTLCCPTDCCPPGSSIHGIFETRILEQLAISSSRKFFPAQGLNPLFCVSGINR